MKSKSKLASEFLNNLTDVGGVIVQSSSSFPDSGVTAGTYSKVTVDSKGRITAGLIPTMEDIPDATFKRSVKAATTSNITLSAPQTIDGIALIAGDRVLVKDQTTTTQNGIYVVQAAAWTRALDANTSSKIASSLVAVDSGTVNGGKLFDNAFKTTDTIDTTAMTWASNLDSGHLLASTSANIGTVAYNGTTAAAGKFDGGTTTPTGTTRLNYSGVFYPTSLNLTGEADTATASSHYFVETASDGLIRPKTLANVRSEIITKAALLTADPYYFSSGVGTSGITGVTNYTLFPPAADTITLAIGTYKIEILAKVTVATSTVSGNLNFCVRGGGTAVGTVYGLSQGSITNAGSPINVAISSTSIANSFQASASSAEAGRVYVSKFEGIMNITSAGTIIPSYQFNTTLTSGVVTLDALNNIMIDKIAVTSVTTTGGWV